MVVAGDGQVSLGQTVIKAPRARCGGSPGGQPVVSGFAGSTADAFTLLERLEKSSKRRPASCSAPPWSSPRTGAPTGPSQPRGDADRQRWPRLCVITGAGDVSSRSTMSPPSDRAATTRSPRRARSTTRTSTPRRTRGGPGDRRRDLRLHQRQRHRGKSRCRLSSASCPVTAGRLSAAAPLAGAPMSGNGGAIRTWSSASSATWSRAATRTPPLPDRAPGLAGRLHPGLVRRRQPGRGGRRPWVAELPPDAVGVDLASARASLPLAGGRLRRAGAPSPAGSSTRATGPVSSTRPENARAVRAYEKAGFRPDPRLEGRTGDALIMQYQADNGRSARLAGTDPSADLRTRALQSPVGYVPGDDPLPVVPAALAARLSDPSYPGGRRRRAPVTELAAEDMRAAVAAGIFSEAQAAAARRPRRARRGGRDAPAGAKTSRSSSSAASRRSHHRRPRPGLPRDRGAGQLGVGIVGAARKAYLPTNCVSVAFAWALSEYFTGPAGPSLPSIALAISSR